MALSSHVGNFTQPTTINASFAVTGVGFKPKVVLFFASAQTADGSGADAFEMLGAATSSSDRRTAAFRDVNNTNGFPNITVNHDNTKCIAIVDSNSADTSPKVAADLVSLDSDGFTLNFSTVDATARVINYFAIGGADLTNAQTGQLQEPASTGNQSITGVGFKPDCVIFWQERVTGTAPPDTGGHSGVGQLSFAVSSTKRGATSGGAYDGNSTPTVHSFQSSSLAIATYNPSSGTIEKADLVSMDSDGFTLNWTAVTANTYHFFLALKGGQYTVGSFNQTTSAAPVDQSVTGINFQPTAVMFSSFNAATNASAITNARKTIGVGSSPSNRFSLWYGEANSTNPSVSSNNLDRSNILKMMTEGGGSPTNNATADLKSLDVGGFTLHWTATDATAREILYLAMGSNAPTTAVKMQAIRGWSFPI